MNIPSLILLAVILIATAFTIRKVYRSKGACDDCSSATCPVKGAAAVHTDDSCDCCK